MKAGLCGLILGATLSISFISPQVFAQEPDKPVWPRHIIDDSSRGADGVRLLDVNHDGLPDIATGWEEGGLTRAYLHPGFQQAAQAWPAVTVGQTRSVEDAVFCDLDCDGAADVITCCEGDNKRIFVHWAPPGPAHYLRPDAWTTRAIPATQGRSQWMFAVPLQLDGQHGPDILIGSKGEDALVGWLQAPANPRNLDEWKLHTLYRAGWIMTLAPIDIDADGDLDIVISDRKGVTPGVLWLENPGPQAVLATWPEHRIGASGREVMFLDVADLDDDGIKDVVCAVKPGEIHWFHHPSDPQGPWPAHIIPVDHPLGIGTAKAVCTGDIDRDGKLDIAYSCEMADPPKRGVVWLSFSSTPMEADWTSHDISGPEGIKFDRIELVDLDGDADLDLLTCEERHQGKGLGVFWYENPYDSPR